VLRDVGRRRDTSVVRRAVEELLADGVRVRSTVPGVRRDAERRDALADEGAAPDGRSPRAALRVSAPDRVAVEPCCATVPEPLEPERRTALPWLAWRFEAASPRVPPVPCVLPRLLAVLSFPLPWWPLPLW
jgi:hypothetical protein